MSENVTFKMTALPKGRGSSLVIVKIDSSSETDAADAVDVLQSSYDIHKQDVVISSAGTAKPNTLVDLLIAELQEHITVNSIGPLLLFKAVVPLLEKSS